jgi:metallo-beta-lactamase superfamily protein
VSSLSAATTQGTAFAPDLAAIRALAGVLPGPLPVAVNGIRVAASIRPRKFVIQGGDDSAVTMPRTAFQFVYPDGTVMIDSGMDKATHDSFSPEKPEPYYADAFAKLERALVAARLIILTHFHADHVAGVVTAKNFSALAAKTIASTLTLYLMVTSPHRPHLKISQAQAGQFIALDYAEFYPVGRGADQGARPQSRPADGVCAAAVRRRNPAQRRLGLDLRQHSAGETEGRAVGEGRRTGDHGAAALVENAARHRAEPDDPRDARRCAL